MFISSVFGSLVCAVPYFWGWGEATCSPIVSVDGSTCNTCITTDGGFSVY